MAPRKPVIGNSELYGAGAILRLMGCAAADSRLTNHQLRVFNTVVSFSDFESAECWPSLSTVGDILGSPRQSVQRSMRKLESLGYVFRQRQHHRNGGYKSNRYHPNTSLANVHGRVVVPIGIDGFSFGSASYPMPPAVDAGVAPNEGGKGGTLQGDAQREHLRNQKKLPTIPDAVSSKDEFLIEKQKAKELWLSIESDLRLSLGDSDFNTWLSSELVEPVFYDGQCLVLKAVNHFTKKWIVENHLAAIEENLDCEVSVRV